MFECMLTVVAVETVAEGVNTLTLANPAGLLPEWAPGAHIDLVLGEHVVRQYSLCGDPADSGVWRIAVLREDGGRGGSRYVHDRLYPGAQVLVRGPRNNFPLVPADGYRFVAGGIGITPILPMIRAAEAAGTRWTLTYGGRTRASMAFAGELAGYGERVEFVPQDERGLLDLDALLGESAPGVKVYCCGPEGLLSAVEQRCVAWSPGSLHVERFAPREPVDHESGSEFEVVFDRSGKTVKVGKGQSILGAATTVGIEVLSSCEEGTCGTCETKVVAGEPDHRDSVLTDDERESGDVMMICVSRSRGPVLTLDL